jgi:hypothetical protein
MMEGRERLGERVDVGPAEALGAHAAVVDEGLGHPGDAGGLCLGRDGLGSGLAAVGPGGGEEPAKGGGLPRLVLDADARRLGRLVLRAPVDVVGQGCLRRDSLANSGHVGGRDVHHVRIAATLEQRAVDAEGAADVRVEGLVDGRIERHRRGAVDDDVDIARKLPDVGEAAVDDGDAPRHLLEGLLLTADRLDPVGEDGLAHELREPLLDGRAALGPNEYGDAGLRICAQQAL